VLTFRTHIPNRSPSKWAEWTVQKDFMDQLATKMQIKKPEDWYKVSSDNIKRNGGAGLVDFYDGSLYKLLSAVYPKYPMETCQLYERYL
jgi:hypothetical protein